MYLRPILSLSSISREKTLGCAEEGCGDGTHNLLQSWWDNDNDNDKDKDNDNDNDNDFPPFTPWHSYE